MARRKPVKLPRYVTLAEFDAMVSSSSNERNKMILKCLFYLGLRNNELKNLVVEKIDLPNRIVHIKKGKGKVDREIPIPSVFYPDLKSYIGKRREGFLIEGFSEGAISNTHIRRLVKKCAERASDSEKLMNPKGIHPHSLRHGYATYLRNQGVSLEEIQELLGHARLETTRIYAHLAKDKLKKVVDNAFSRQGVH